MVVEIKDKESKPDSDYDLENNEKREIIDAYPTAIVMTTTIQPKEPADPEEGECLFHSNMWVKATPLHFIFDRGSCWREFDQTRVLLRLPTKGTM
jgi:hypothetical protein